MTPTEFTNLSTNEAIQANLVIYNVRDELLRMAPWNCATNFNNLTYITSSPGTPENTSSGLSTWQKGIPAPPWAYEYAYPVDCVRPLWIVPQFTTGFASGIPITTAVTGGTPAFWNGPPIRFKVSIDQFFPVTGAAVSNPGLSYAAGDQITLSVGPNTSPPIGYPAVLQVVTTTGGGGAISTIAIVNSLAQAEPENSEPQSGGYFTTASALGTQASTTGVGAGATFTLTLGPRGDQRVILTNQEFALLAYLKQVTDPNVMDSQFIQAWVSILGARLAMALTGDKQLANGLIAQANSWIMIARVGDGNEGLTINDVTPDWIRGRGIQLPNWEYSPNNAQFDWGPTFTPY